MSRRSKGVGSRGLSDPLGRRGSSGGSKRSRVSKPKKYRLKIDEKDLEKLCEPFANQKLTFKCYLYTRDGSLYNRDDRPKLTVSLYYADNTFAQSKNSTSSKRAFSSLENVIAGKACGTDFLTVSGNEINEEGEAKVSVSVLKLSKDVKNRSFRLRFRMDGEEFKGIPHVLSEPFKTYNHKLKVLNKIEETFYKEEGGLQKSMLLSLELHSVSGLETKLEVPLILTLHYDDAKKTQLNSDSQKFLRVMDDQSELKIVKGKAAIRFRINDVSKNHQKLLFCVRVAPENIPKYRDVAFAFTSGVKVLSKRNKTKRKPANVLSGIGNNMGTGVEGTIAESSAESNLDNKALYRIQIPANVKKKIQSEEKVPLANLVMIVSQYAAKTSMWMDDVVKRHKRFKSDWDKYVAPCIAQLVQHVKDNVQEEGGSAGTGRVSASTSSSTNRPRKKPRMSNPTETESGSSSLDAPALVPTSSLTPLGPGESVQRGTSYEIAKLFSSGGLPDIDMGRLHSLTSMGRRNSVMGVDASTRSSSLFGSDLFTEIEDFDAEWKSETTSTLRDRTAWIEKDFFQNCKGIRVGYPAYAENKQLLGFYKSVNGSWMFTKKEALISNNTINSGVVQTLVARANMDVCDLKAVDDSNTATHVLSTFL